MIGRFKLNNNKAKKDKVKQDDEVIIQKTNKTQQKIADTKNCCNSIEQFSKANNCLLKGQKRKDHGVHSKKLRRRHLNSKNGCLECKKRKIKCDESLPECSSCLKRGIKCSFLTKTPFQIYKMEQAKNLIKQFQTSTTSSIEVSIAPSPASTSVSDNENLTTGNSEFIKSQDSEISQMFFNLEAVTPNMNQTICETSAIVLSTDEAQIEFHNESSIPLFVNTKKSEKVFKTNNKKVMLSLDDFQKRIEFLVKLTTHKEYKKLKEIFKDKNIDAVLQEVFFQFLSLASIFDKLLMKAFLLFANDYYKNIILMQNCFSSVNYKVKLALSGQFEEVSSALMNAVVCTIKYEYLPFFNTFSDGTVDIFTGSLMLLDKCLPYHFKKGSSYELTIDESNRAVNLCGIFSTGLYAVIMEKSKDRLVMSATNIISSHIVNSFKRLFIKPYPFDVFYEFKRIVTKIKRKTFNNISCENLELFCCKVIQLTPTNLEEHSLLGFNAGYAITLLNSLQSIIPFDICNLKAKYINLFNQNEFDITVYLCYYTLGHMLNSMLPGLGNITSNGFVDAGFKIFEIDNIKSMIKVIQSIQSKEAKLFAIYLLRTATYFKNRKLYYQNYLAKYNLDKLLDTNSISTPKERYERLNIFKSTISVHERDVRTFSINKGLFFKRWNYPIDSDSVQKGVAWNDVTISSFFSNNDNLIADFVENNNGFFSLDYDCAKELETFKEVTPERSISNGCEMKILWELIMYIRKRNM